ncbi:MAG: 50S ribosomal protein L24 [Candidatus Auribacterota bacterium]|nr:50S ribosomal protein L24 [Candidatus Auribacterota bacterium]
MRARIKKGDIVIAVAGKERFSGKTGKVLQVNKKSGTVIVQGLNFVKRHTKPSQQNQKGGIIEKEAPIAISNVMPYCPTSKKGTRIGIKFLKDGTKIRFSKRSGEGLDK